MRSSKCWVGFSCFVVYATAFVFFFDPVNMVRLLGRNSNKCWLKF
jgi:hypothetical protein